MKLIAESAPTKFGVRVFIAEVAEDEIYQVFNRSRYDSKPSLNLKVGSEVNIGEGHNFRNEIIEATKSMSAAYDRFAKAVPIMTEFTKLVTKE